MIGHDIKASCWFIELLLTVLGGILEINGVDFFLILFYFILVRER